MYSAVRRYYNLEIEYWTHEKNELELARCYKAIYTTPSIEADEDQANLVRPCCSLSSVDTAHHRAFTCARWCVLASEWTVVLTSPHPSCPQALQSHVLFLAMAEFDCNQDLLLKTAQADKRLEKLAEYK